MSQREQPAFPRRMTEYDAAPGYRDAKSWAAAGVVSTGLELSHQLVRYLDYSMRHETLDDRERAMEEINPEMARAYRMRQQGISPVAIAETFGCSVRAVHYALARARAWLREPFEQAKAEAKTPEDRLLLLKRGSAIDRRAYQVYVLASYGWTQDRVAEMLDVSVDTVKRDIKRARAFVGEEQIRRRMFAEDALEVAA